MRREKADGLSASLSAALRKLPARAAATNASMNSSGGAFLRKGSQGQRTAAQHPAPLLRFDDGGALLRQLSEDAAQDFGEPIACQRQALLRDGSRLFQIAR